MEAVFSNVTVAIDDSVEAQRGIDFAIELGRNGASVHFCSVVDASRACLGGGIGAPIDVTATVQEMQREAESVCDAAVNTARTQGVVADGKVVFGAVAPEIGKYVQERKSGALVIGTHARTGIGRAYFGSVAERLMQSSDIPVVVTHRDDVAGDGPITVAIDDSPSARAALQAAIELARAQQQSLSIVTVVDRSSEQWREAEALLETAADIARTAGIDFDLVTLEGHAIETIVASAHRRHSPMIFVGTHGRSDLARLLLGSVAAGVVEHAQVPVTVVRG
jgi:nucleotide-binding universal stress UspA family protein